MFKFATWVSLLFCFALSVSLSASAENIMEGLEAVCPVTDSVCRDLIARAFPQNNSPNTPRTRTSQYSRLPAAATESVTIAIPHALSRQDLPLSMEGASIVTNARGAHISFESAIAGGGRSIAGTASTSISLGDDQRRCLNRHYAPVSNRIRHAGEGPLTAAENEELLSAERLTLSCIFPAARIQPVQQSNRMTYFGARASGRSTPGIEQGGAATFVAGIQNVQRFRESSTVSFMEGGFGGINQQVAGVGRSVLAPHLFLRMGIETALNSQHPGWSTAVRVGLEGGFATGAGSGGTVTATSAEDQRRIGETGIRWDGGVSISVGRDLLRSDLMLALQGVNCQFRFEEIQSAPRRSTSDYVIRCGPGAIASWTPSERRALIARIHSYGGVVEESGDSSLRVIFGMTAEGHVRLGEFYTGAQFRIEHIVNRQLAGSVSEPHGPIVEGQVTAGYAFP